MQKAFMLGVAGAFVLVTACNADRLTLPNQNTVTQEEAAGATGVLQLQVAGVLRRLRGGRQNFITTTARFGREGYVYTPNEGRFTSNFLIGLPGENRIDPAGFAAGAWTTHYGDLRDIHVTRQSVNASALLTPEQNSAMQGMLGTFEGLELLYLISTRDTIGIVVEIKDNPQELAPFVSRDSAYSYIMNTLDAAYAQLQAGGAAFPVTLHEGFAGFDTPPTFAQFNRAIAARAAAYSATSGGGATSWARAAAAMAASFLNRAPATLADLNVGVYNVHSLATGDSANGVDSTGNTDFVGHPSLRTDAQLKADGVTQDDRFTRKTFTLPTARNAPQGLGIPTDLGLRVYKTQEDPVPIVRNEELILLDAEIRLATGDKAGAIANINAVRTISGGLPPSTLTAGSPDADVLLGILYEKRYSLLAEGHRWIDMRRYGLLATLPLDITTGVNAHFVAKVIPVPQAECLVRARSDPSLAGPGC